MARLSELDELHAPHAVTPLSAFSGTFLGLGGLSICEIILRGAGIPSAIALVFIASFGALSTLLYAAPAAPLGKPKNMFFGHTISMLIAFAVHLAVKPLLELIGLGLPLAAERAIVPALAIGAMVYYKVPHPPAGACVVIYATLPDPSQQTPFFLLLPVLLGCAYMLAVQWAVAAGVKHFTPAADAPAAAEPSAAASKVSELYGKVEPAVKVAAEAYGKVDAPLSQLDKLHAPHAVTPISAFAGTLLAMGGLSAGEVLLGTVHAPTPVAYLFIGSFGALSTLLYAAPAAPLGKPKNMFWGHTISVMIGMAAHLLLSPLLHLVGLGLPLGLVRALVPALAIGAMVAAKVPHPPAAACVAVYVTLADDWQQTPMFLLLPVLLGCAYMLFVQWLVTEGVRVLAPPAEPPAKEPPTLGELIATARDMLEQVGAWLLTRLSTLDELHAPHAVTPLSAFSGTFLG